MASPQIENGYTKIADEVMDALCAFRIPGTVRQVIDCVLRKTYGWDKKEDWISQSQIIAMTKLSKGCVSRELSKAITHKLVIAYDNKLRFNKNYEEWISFGGNHFNPKPKGKKLSHTITKKVIACETKVIACDGYNKHYTINNIINNKDLAVSKTTKIPLKEDLNELLDLFKGVNPNYELLFKNKTERNALQRQVDKFSYERIKNLLLKLPEIVARPYAPRITRPVELEKKMGQLIIFLNQEKQGKRKVVDARGI